MKKLLDVLNSVEEKELNKVMFDSVLEHCASYPDEHIIKILNDDYEIFGSQYILAVFLKNLKINLSEFGFEEDESSEYGYSDESSDEDNSIVFTYGLLQDVNEFVEECIGLAQDNDGELEESPKLGRLWNE